MNRYKIINFKLKIFKWLSKIINNPIIIYNQKSTKQKQINNFPILTKKATRDAIKDFNKYSHIK